MVLRFGINVFIRVLPYQYESHMLSGSLFLVQSLEKFAMLTLQV